MNLLYCFANVSLTKRILRYLSKKLEHHTASVTVIFSNDFWIVHVNLKSSIAADELKNAQAVFNENGIPCLLAPRVEQAVSALEAGYNSVAVMERYHVVVISHGVPRPEEIEHFREKFVRGLGYCPPSLV